ncbi:MAG: 16S rRNA (guanine(966)-N(2))-methyltransferase RsmD [Desulfocapsa sp.]|nr:16S rRNA (guanine(966)-N(2))-methyltransferase RsmD [Desulfocapsa sp.]
MRIISGLARGRKLATPGQSKAIRPTSDRAREALFSIIGTRVESARVLDLFAGTGALGIEALSRGAEYVVFVDYYQTALQLIKQNCLSCMQSMGSAFFNTPVIIKHDLRRNLNLNFPQTVKDVAFDLIFLDPPYGQDLAETILNEIDKSDLIGSSTLIIAEERSGATLTQSFNRIHLSDQRKYGDTGFWFYTVKTS